MAVPSRADGFILTTLSKADENYHRATELKAFDDTKAGVKGLVDGGISEIPRIFYRPPDEDNDVTGETGQIHIPVIDLEDVEKDAVKREKTVGKIREASEKLGIFQVINHGIPESVVEEMKNAVREFHEQDTEVKKRYYTRDRTKPLFYNSNFDLFTAPITSWRDTFGYVIAPTPPNPQDLPQTISDILLDFPKQMMKIGKLVLELLSEALGLNPNYLNKMGCSEGFAVGCHYYPPCPQPKLALGTAEHHDNDFITVLFQDPVGGLQIRHHQNWFDVAPLAGAMVINMGELMQLITNDRFKSVVHRVLAKQEGPRISVVGFFTTLDLHTSKLYGPIKELLSEDDPPKYRETTVRDLFHQMFRLDGLQISTLLPLRLLTENN